MSREERSRQMFSEKKGWHLQQNLFYAGWMKKESARCCPALFLKNGFAVTFPIVFARATHISILYKIIVVYLSIDLLSSWQPAALSATGLWFQLFLFGS